MKSIFDGTTRSELINRINTLNENSLAKWGKMNIYQMMKHCVMCEEMYLGKKKYKRTFLGRLIGQMALKGILKDENPMKRNAPTHPAFRIKENQGDVITERKKWVALIKEYESFSNDDFSHWFFGKMTKEQIGYFNFKHIDHHLRQFGA